MHTVIMFLVVMGNVADAAGLSGEIAGQIGKIAGLSEDVAGVGSMNIGNCEGDTCAALSPSDQASLMQVNVERQKKFQATSLASAKLTTDSLTKDVAATGTKSGALTDAGRGTLKVDSEGLGPHVDSEGLGPHLEERAQGYVDSDSDAGNITEGADGKGSLLEESLSKKDPAPADIPTKGEGAEIGGGGGKHEDFQCSQQKKINGDDGLCDDWFKCKNDGVITDIKVRSGGVVDKMVAYKCSTTGGTWHHFQKWFRSATCGLDGGSECVVPLGSEGSSSLTLRYGDVIHKIGGKKDCGGGGGKKVNFKCPSGTKITHVRARCGVRVDAVAFKCGK